MNGYKGQFMMVDPTKVLIDHRYQRAQKNSLVSQIAQNPRWDAFGVPTVFKRANGQMYAADGQQRIAGVLASAKPPKEIPVVIFEINDLPEEAEAFVLINEWRKALQPIEKHKAKIQANEPAALAVEKAVTSAGYTIDTGVGSGPAHARTIQAVAGVNMIYNRIGEEGLHQTLLVINDAWTDDPAALSAHILRGVGQLIEESGENYNKTRLVNALKKTQPYMVERKADELRFKFGGSKRVNVRLAFQDLAGLKLPRNSK